MIFIDHEFMFLHPRSFHLNFMVLRAALLRIFLPSIYFVVSG